MNIDNNTLGDLSGFLSFQQNFILWALMDCECDTIFIETGNRAGKTASVAKNYILRILGIHPIEKKNLRPSDPVRIIRLASETLPMEKDAQGEVRNTIYPQIKQFLPPSLIKKDITMRKPTITLRDPQGGKDIILEFVSYGQTVQAQAGVQRWSIYLDEEPHKSFYEEQIARLILPKGLTSGKDVILGLTPTENITWTYEDLYQKAKIIYNSPSIVKYLKDTTGITHQIKEQGTGYLDIAVIRAATDDNPTLSVKDIEDRISVYDDAPTIAARRYGIFHQISGVIFQEFDQTHIISKDKYFPDGMPHDWLHARGIDFHEHTNWACGFIALSNQNEAFIYDEYNPSPDRMITLQIIRELAHRSKDYKYKINLVDPWADKKQINTGLSPLDDINRIFNEFKREGVGMGGYFQTWDTKSMRGRDILKQRFKNSRAVGRPFNNRMVQNGMEFFLPTIWILDNCVQSIYQFKNWRWEQWATREANATKEDKNKAEDKNSHFPVTYECIFKHAGFRTSLYPQQFIGDESPYNNYFQPRSRV